LNVSTASNPAYKIPANRPSNLHQINQQIGMMGSAHTHNQCHSANHQPFASIENPSNSGIENFSNNQRELELLKLLDTTIKWIVIPNIQESNNQHWVCSWAFLPSLQTHPKNQMSQLFFLPLCAIAQFPLFM
jgi:catalase